MIKSVLSIAGSDCSGGAGIQADLKTIFAHGMYGMSVITAITAQNTLGVTAIEAASSDIVAKQIDSVFTDIRPDSVKIGMAVNENIVCTMAEKLIFHNAKNIIIDPVLVSTSGKPLLQNTATAAFKERLLPLARLITPNIPEAELLSGIHIENNKDMEKAAEKLYLAYNTSVLIKGGHAKGSASDLLYCGANFYWFTAEKIQSTNTHGTGCTLSSAIACNIADGMSMYESVDKAKEYITRAIAAGLDLGKGNGPLCHNV